MALVALYVIALLAVLLYLRDDRPRRIFMIVGLALIDLAGLAYFFAVYLTTRLNGSFPPTLWQVLLTQLWLPVVGLLVINVLVYAVYRFRRAKKS